MNTTTVDVVVIGGGISGLSAAKHLTDHGLDVIVLEARERVGGRTYTIRDPAFQYTDLGGAYIGPTQRRVARLAKDLDLKFYKVNVEQHSLLKYRNAWKTYAGLIPPVYNPFVVMDLNNIQQKMETLSMQVPVEAPWKAPLAESWDSMTVKEFLEKNCWTQFAYDMSAIICLAVLCAEPHEVSLLALLWYIRSGQGLNRVINVTNGAQETKFIGGAMQLSERLAGRMKGKVRLSSTVVHVDQTDDGVKVRIASGEEFRARYVISAMPLSLLNRVAFLPPLPPLKLQLIQRIPMGSIIKTMTFYDRCYWREKGLSGQMVTDSGPVIFCLDDTKPDGSCPCIMGFILANHARHLVNLKSEERKEILAKHYADTFRCPELLHPINYAEKNWMEEEYSGGCYVSNFPPGTLTRYGEEIRRPFRQIYFAGTETATYWAGYMEGAIQAGERAAKEVLHAMGKIPSSDIWVDEPAIPGIQELPITPMLIERILPSVSTFLIIAVSSFAAVGAWLVHRYYK